MNAARFASTESRAVRDSAESLNLPLPVNVRDVARASERVRSVLTPTPVVRSDHFGGWLKLENLQATGSYKVRGALHALMVAVEAGDRRPVVAASAGNHARGVAWAAHHLGLQACVVIPTGAPMTKIRGAAALGAKVISHGHGYEEAQEYARHLARENCWRFLPAFDDPDVIAGQATVGWELLSAAPDVVLVPIGGGGLAAGMGIALQYQNIRVVGVQVQGADAMARALTGQPCLGEPAETIADGIRVRAPGVLTRQICAQVLDDLVTVTEREVRQTLVDLAAMDRIVAEGAGALAPAAMSKVQGERKIAVVSGGNIDMQRFQALLSASASI